MVVLRMSFEMFSKISYAVAQNGYLDLGSTRVFIMLCIITDNILLFLLIDSHYITTFQL